MALTKKARMLDQRTISYVADWLADTRQDGLRDQTIFYLTVYAGMRAKEVAMLTWDMCLDIHGQLDDTITLYNRATKGHKSGRLIPINSKLKTNLQKLLDAGTIKRSDHVIKSQRSDCLSAAAVVNMIHRWYTELGLSGCSSHSGRRTFITNAARNITAVGGSLKDVQALAGHYSLAQTQAYIVDNEAAKRSVVDMI